MAGPKIIKVAVMQNRITAFFISAVPYIPSCFRFPFEDRLALSPFCFFGEVFGLFEVVLLDLRFPDMFSDFLEKNTYHQ